MNLNNILVIGGGTAGWLSALFAQRFFPDANITLVHDNKTDIIGVGESTTPPMVNLFDFLGISVADLHKHCGATIKNATRFTNWNGDNSWYHHGFNTNPNLDIFAGSRREIYTTHEFFAQPHKPLLALKEIFNNQNLDSIHLSAVLSHEDKVPFIKQDDNGLITDFDNISRYGLHFNAKKVAEYLEKIGVSRGITIITGKIIESHLDNDGYVASVLLDNNKKIHTDFIFDCSGFGRLFVDKTYKSPFMSFKKHLPVNKAMPFFLDRTGPIPTYTEAIAMKYGWMWKTPVGERFGCGYVYDSDYISDEEAYEEICEVTKQKPDCSRVLSFESGYFTKPWNKNTLAIGLSSGFLEPLEATSIWICIISLVLFSENLAGSISKDQYAIDEYNKNFEKSIKSILNLVYFHYLTPRSDTEFWRNFDTKTEKPESLIELLEIMKHRTLSISDTSITYEFPPESWFYCAAGQKYFSKEVIEKEYNAYNIENFTNNLDVVFKKKLSSLASKCMDHEEFLKYITRND